MINFVTKLILWTKERSFFRSVQATLVMLMPITVIGSYFDLMNKLVFSPNGLIYNIFNLDKIMSDHIWYGGSFVCRGMVSITFGAFGAYAAFFMARYTARIYHKDSTMAGLSAVLVLLFCSYASSSVNQRLGTTNLLQVNGIFIALMVGYGVGQIFHWLGARYQLVANETAGWIRRRAENSALPLLVSLIFGIMLGIIIYELQLKVSNSGSFRGIVLRLQTTDNLGDVLLLSILVTALAWLGIGYPLESLSGAISNNYTTANLTYALQHGNSWQVPYKFLGSSLINSYGIMGGASVVLAVIVLILLRHRNSNIEALALVNLLPAAFGSTVGFTLGLPIILNPLFLLPMVTLPLINMVLAASAISLNLIPASVYPILTGTPGILIPFFGTNGNWSALVFALMLFLLDLLLLWPLIKVSERIDQQAKLRREATIDVQK
ncbi:PTS sugar transporter subunit IIC [Lactobacillus sp. ESL0684]|uniref:PTS sugar transporter subunit IIC n=1 Tax=Lactobacillus sp. ESL0684 TaxID=2983213 RepID=UPI0023F6FFA8|nr:PTS sugar transporter subunit IIC [Lactobacillus sp. ESL0684]WEV43620.1 PTS sugar transporter subunit IIC [Lactobacillus sp. ESL0684]